MNTSIDDFRDRWLTLTEAAALLPRRRRGRKVAASTLWRWGRYGLDGVFLKVTAVGGSGTCTTLECLENFFEELSVAKGLRKAKSREPRRDEAIDAELAKRGLIDPPTAK